MATHTFGPDNGRLLVRTGRTGAAAKAGHDLVLELTSWRATVDDGERVELEADGSSVRVLEGTGGVQKLDDDDKAGIAQTIDEEVLLRQPITFLSTSVAAHDVGFRAEGELTLLGTTRPLAVDVTVGDDGALTAAAVVKQSEWGLTPYSALFGTLKVADEVRVEVVGRA